MSEVFEGCNLLGDSFGPGKLFALQPFFFFSGLGIDLKSTKESGRGKLFLNVFYLYKPHITGLKGVEAKTDKMIFK